MALDLAKIKLSSNFDSEISVRQELTTIPVRKPKKLEFFRVRPGEEWVFDAYILDIKEDEEDKYLVDPKFYPELMQQGLLKRVRFFFLISYGSGIIFISEVALPDAEGKINTFPKSRLEHYEKAKDVWVKIVADRALKAYKILLPNAKFIEPEWPVKPGNIAEALQIAFRDRYIETEDHPVLKKIRGEL